MDNLFYTYAYLRIDGTPYYIGKGKGRRAYSRNRKVKRPPEDSRILILKKGLTEEEAFEHERYMIYVFGRVDNGSGILWNFTNGGEGISGYAHSEETLEKMRRSAEGREILPGTRTKIAESVKGFKWYNNGVENKQARSHPGEGWVEGRLLDWDTPRSKGMKWYHKNGKRKMFREDPGDGWIQGRLDVPRENNPTNRGKSWYNDGKINRMFVEPPKGWNPGMIRRKDG